MVVQHNMQAANANRQLGVVTNAQAKSTEKLSSGYRINRAGDDAAGLKISEKMRSQINGLNKASSNAEDGVSLIQTAEGALNEAHSILQRMNELAVQGANDTNQDIDRDAINQELTALTTELDRIASTTQFNKQNLLDGTFKNKNLQVGANTNQNIGISISAMNATGIGLNDAVLVSASVNRYTVSTAANTVKSFTTKASALSAYRGVVSKAAGANATADAKSIAGVKAAQSTKIVSLGGKFYIGGTFDKNYSTVELALDALTARTAESKINTVEFTGNVTITSPTVSTYAKANATLSKIQNAINNVSSQRSALGALQNRLEHTIANLDNVAENTQSAESRIRDTDMADEMVTYSKNNILAQAGQSMLAQANQSTQGVLSLLQ